jgi:hypothetical protein
MPRFARLALRTQLMQVLDMQLAVSSRLHEAERA